MTATSVRKAVLLAAGSGTRLEHLTEDLPKCLLAVGGRLLLDRQLEAFAAAGIDDITIVAGFRADQVIAHVAGRCRVIVNDRFATTNSIVSLELAAPHVAGDAFVFQNADVVYEPALMRRFVTAPRTNACLVDPYLPWSADEYDVATGDGRIVRYARDVPADQSVGRSAQLVKIGVADSAAFFARLRKLVAGGGDGGFPNQAYDVLMQGEGLWPVYTAGLSWWEIDTVDDYDRADRGIALDEEDAPEAVPVQSIASRLGSFLRVPRVPYRFRWLPLVAREALRSPRRTLAHVVSFRRGVLTAQGLDLRVNGGRVLAEVYHEAARHELRPMLLWGTLLGCVRQGSFIRNDRDIDLGLMEIDCDGLEGFKSAMLGRGYRVRIENPCKLSLVHPIHPNLFIDIDIVRRYRDGWAITHLIPGEPRRFHYLFPDAVFAGTRAATFEGGVEVLLPADPAGFLTAAYSDWRTPQARVHFLYGPHNLEVEITGIYTANETAGTHHQSAQ